MPRLDTATRNIVIMVVSRPVNHRMQSLDFIMFTGARFADSCNGTSNPVQQLTVNVLADLGSHQQPKIATSGYITWETGPWQQEQQHQMSQVCDEYRQTVRNRLRENGLRPRRPYFGAVLRRRHRLARIRWCNRVRAGTCKTGGESGSAMNQDSCCRKEMAVHVSTDAGMRSSQGTVPWGRQFRRRKCDDVGCHILRRKTQLVHIHGNLNAARYRDEVLTPYMLPEMNIVGNVFSTTAHSSCYCWLSS